MGFNLKTWLTDDIVSAILVLIWVAVICVLVLV